jgi:hypothetical protein
MLVISPVTGFIVPKSWFPKRVGDTLTNTVPVDGCTAICCTTAEVVVAVLT